MFFQAGWQRNCSDIAREVARSLRLVLLRQPDFLDVRDVCSALATILEQDTVGVRNVGSGIETKVSYLLDVFLRYADLQDKVEIQQETDHDDPIPRHIASIDRLRTLGFSPQHPLHRSAQEMLDYLTRLMQSQAQS